MGSSWSLSHRRRQPEGGSDQYGLPDPGFAERHVRVRLNRRFADSDQRKPGGFSLSSIKPVEEGPCGAFPPTNSSGPSSAQIFGFDATTEFHPERIKDGMQAEITLNSSAGASHNKDMEFTDVMKARHSVRDFSPKPVSPETIREIVRLAGHAPSWVNAQPCHVYVAMGATLDRIKESHMRHVEKGDPSQADWPIMHRDQWGQESARHMADFRQTLAALQEAHRIDPEAWAQAETGLFRAPAVAYLTAPRVDNLWPAYDLGAFGQSLMLAAKDKGLDSIPAYEFVRYPQEIRTEFSIPDDQALAIGIALGYPTDSSFNLFHPGREDIADFLVTKG